MFFGYETKGKNEYIYPLRISGLQRAHVVNLMLISAGEKSHYCWIKDVGRLLSSQTTDDGHNKKFYCQRCLNSFSSPTALDNHERYCKSNE